MNRKVCGSGCDLCETEKNHKMLSEDSRYSSYGTGWQYSIYEIITALSLPHIHKCTYTESTCIL